MQTTTWTKSDINPSDDKPRKPTSSTDQTETISVSEKDADENETEQIRICTKDLNVSNETIEKSIIDRLSETKS